MATLAFTVLEFVEARVLSLGVYLDPYLEKVLPRSSRTFLNPSYYQDRMMQSLLTILLGLCINIRWPANISILLNSSVNSLLRPASKLVSLLPQTWRWGLSLGVKALCRIYVITPTVIQDLSIPFEPWVLLFCEDRWMGTLVMTI